MIADGDGPASATRPPVSVIVPFAGDAGVAARLRDALGRLRLAPGDELIVADNSVDGAFWRSGAGNEIAVVAATEERSAPYARNVGAEIARNDWLLFTDDDCAPEPGLLDAYFAEPVDERTGMLAGGVLPAAGDGALVRWAASRHILDQEAVIGGDPRATGPKRRNAVSANLMVRASALNSVGGFLEGVVCGEDYDLCWRLQDGGWGLEPRFHAAVHHRHREGLGDMWRQMVRYGASNAWQHRRWHGAAPRPALIGPLAKSLGGIVVFGLTLQFDRARMKALDGIAALGLNVGYMRSNVAPVRAARSERGERAVLVTERFGGPTASADGFGRVVAIRRDDHQKMGGTRGTQVDYIEDESQLERAGSLVGLVIRHPLRSIADLWRRRRFGACDRLPLRWLAPMASRLDRGSEIKADGSELAAATAARLGALTR